MRRSQIFASIFLLMATISFSGSAFADSMTFNSVGGNNSGGVYTYPYNFTVNGTPMQLLCDTFDNEITFGETWTATEHSIPGTGRLFDSSDVNAVRDYQIAGIIFDGILGINGFAQNPDTNAANWAIWSIFSSNANISGNPNALAIYNAALAIVLGNPPSSDFAGIVVYTPDPGSQSGRNGTPQEFIGYTPVPEPSELSLMAVVALSGIAGVAFRKRLSSRLAIAAQA